MGRKRTIADEDLLDAALDVVRAGGPDALTFAAVAARAGLAASTIVQRFGTKAGLLRAALSRAWDHLDAATATAVADAAPGPGGVIDLLVALSGQYGVDDDFADQLLLLREDLRDPVLRARGEAWLAVLTGAVEQRLGDAPGGAGGLGDLVVAQWQGTLTVWGFLRHSPLGGAVRAALEDLIARLGLDPMDRGP
ncbi:MAG TPA: TetR family transcriptional regulator [Acidimicrobiales bacterium]|nr:TetR family transcriptional regulator [Acidimicrobiales bacterium]